MKNQLILLVTTIFLTSMSCAKSKPDIPSKDSNLIFKAAGFAKTKHGWEGKCETGEITVYRDLNNDRLNDAVISDYSSMCYGNTGVGYYLVSQQKNGKWKTIFENAGIPTFLKSTGKDGWPDIENGGPGLCFAVYRWDGKSYEVNRYEYQGKACSLN
jgi:hypothetical protein